MAVTAIYSVEAGQNAPSLMEFTDRLMRTYNPMVTGSWGLDHRVFHSLPSGTIDVSSPRFQHVLTLGHHPDRAFVHISSPEEQQDSSSRGQATATIAIPLSQMELYSQLTSVKLGALWVYRMGSLVESGMSYSLGELTIRTGMVYEKGGLSAIRGFVVCIQTAHEQDSIADKQELHAGQALVREMWASLADGAQANEIITSHPFHNANDRTFDEVRLWCEALGS